MKPNIKRVMAIHDLSGFGRASLTNIIPVLSTMGMQVCPLPTAVLSTHSGGFTEYTFTDLTEQMLSCTAHWKALDLSFDCIYSGFLGSPKQAEIVEGIIRNFREKDTLVVVDPVMGDAGVLYTSVSDEIVHKMKALIKTADIITPNFTEACMLLEIPYRENVNEEEAKLMLQALAEKNNGTVVITSMPHESNEKLICTTAYDKRSNHFWRTFIVKEPHSYPGTGDIFASVLVGSILQGDSLPIAMDRATQFISQCIKASQSYDYPEKYGVLLEKELHLLRESHLICEYEEF